MTALAFSIDGKRLVTGGHDGTVRFWQTTSGKAEQVLIRVPPDKPCRFAALAFSPDGKILAVGDSRGAINLYDAANSKRLRGFIAHERSEVRSLAFSPDGERLVSGDWDSTLGLWTVASGKEVARTKVRNPRNQICEVAFSPDGKTFASAALSDPDLRFWDAATGKEVRCLRGTYGFLSVRFAPDGKSLVTGGQDGLVRIWDITTGKEVRRMVDRKGWVTARLSPDGRRVAEASGQILRLWDAKTGEEILAPHGHIDTVWSVALSPDRRTAATADATNPGILRFWDLTTVKELRHCEGHGGDLGRIAFTPDGKGLVSTGADGTVRLWDVATAKEIRCFEGSAGFGATLALSPDGAWLAEASPDGLRGWVVATGNPLPWLTVKGRVLRSAAFSTDGKLLATGGWHKEISLWDPSTGQEIRRLEGHTGSVYSVAFSPDGKTLASTSCNDRYHAGAGEDFEIRFWDVSTGRESRRLQGAKGGAYELAFSADGKLLVSAGGDGRVRLWEVATGKERLALVGHQGPVTSLALSGEGRIILSGSVDTTALVWDITGLAAEERPRITGKELAALWTDLESEDALRAFGAMSRLSRIPVQSLPFIQERLKPTRAPDEKHVARLLGDLESDQFAEREKATEELQRMGEVAESALRAAIADKPAVELRKRVGLLLEKLDVAPDRLRGLRCIEMLERLVTPEAKEVLRALSTGAPKAWLTGQAEASLRRLAVPISSTLQKR